MLVAGARTGIRAPLMVGAGTALALALGFTVRSLPWPLGTALVVGAVLLAVGMRRERHPVAGFGRRASPTCGERSGAEQDLGADRAVAGGEEGAQRRDVGRRHLRPERLAGRYESGRGGGQRRPEPPAARAPARPPG